MPIIDRFEGDLALWEGGCAPRSLLPPGAREGDVIEEDGQGGYLLAPEAGQARRASMAARLLALFRGSTQAQ